VVADSPAADAGLRAGDEIVSLQQRPAGQLRLERVRAAFRREGAVLLCIRRGDETGPVTLQLRHLI
jgi:C-terminal processing protease CtpA/Prc